VIGVPATAYVLAPLTDEVKFEQVNLGPTSQFTSESGFAPTAATYVEDPANPNTSAGLAWVHSTGKSNTDWLAQDAMFVVFSNRCMHLGCPVAASKIGFACPCHGGQYDTRGVRTAGPPIRPLDRFQWEVKNDDLVLTNRWSVDFLNGKLTYFPVKMPGQPVDLGTPSIINDHIPDLLYPNVTYQHGTVPKPK
jgi:Rieske Fe-S protein